MDAIIPMKPLVVVPGHGPASRDVERDLVLTRDYLAYLRRTMGQAVADLDSFDDAYAKTDWSRFKAAAGLRAGEPHQCLRHLPADGAGSAQGTQAMSARRSSHCARFPSVGQRTARRETSLNAPTDPVLAVAVRAARRAAAVIGDASRDLKRLPTYSKEHGEIVSTADKEAEQAIVATISSAFPDHAIAGEDSDNTPASERRLAVSLDRRSARRHDELRSWLPVFRRVDRARARQRADARGRARPGPRRALHRDQGTRRATQQRADPHVGVHAHAGCAHRHCRPDAEEPAAEALPADLQRACRALHAAARGRELRSTWPTSRRAGWTGSSR